MERSGKRISASLLTMVMVLSIAVSMITPVVAAPVKPGQDAIAYLEPKDSTASYGNSQTIDVFINSTVPIRSGKMTIVTSDNVCGNITGANWNNTFWDNGAANVYDGGNKTILGFAATSDQPAGVYNIGSFTLQCESAGSCSCYLNFTSESYVYNSSGDLVMDIDVSTNCVENGTFTCTAEAAPINVDLRADSITGNIFDVSGYTVNPGTVTEDGITIDNQTAMGAVVAYCQDNGMNVNITMGTYGEYLVQIGDNASDEYNWMYAVDEVVPWVGGAAYDLSGGEKVHWYNYMLNYYTVLTTLDKTSIYPGDDITAMVTWKNTTGTYPLSGAEVFVSDTAYMPGTSVGTTGADGNVTFQWSTPGMWYVYAEHPTYGSGIYNYPPVSFTCTATEGVVAISTTVGTAPPEVVCKCEGPDDNPVKPGTQVEPNLWPDTETIMKCAIVCDPNGVGDIKYVNATTYYPNGTIKETQTMHVADESERAACCCDTTGLPNETCQVYAGYITMEACDPAGDYMVNVTATDNGGAIGELSNTFEYLSIIGLDLDLNAVGFGTIVPGETKIVPGDDVWGAPNLTVHSIGNDPINITVSATDMTSGGNKITKDNIDCEIDALGAQWLSEPYEFGIGLECCSYENVNLSLHVPEGTAQGTYTGTVTFVAKHA